MPTWARYHGRLVLHLSAFLGTFSRIPAMCHNCTQKIGGHQGSSNLREWPSMWLVWALILTGFASSGPNQQFDEFLTRTWGSKLVKLTTPTHQISQIGESLASSLPGVVRWLPLPINTTVKACQNLVILTGFWFWRLFDEPVGPNFLCVSKANFSENFGNVGWSEIAGIVESRLFWQFRQCAGLPNGRLSTSRQFWQIQILDIAGIVEALPKMPELSKFFIFWICMPKMASYTFIHFRGITQEFYSWGHLPYKKM